MPKLERTWQGSELNARMNRANARAVISMATYAAMYTKEVTHVISGTLKRSVHAAPVGYEPDEQMEEAAAQAGDLMGMFMGMDIVTYGEFGAWVEVGSWLPYACAEWVGRGHPGITQGMEMVRGAMADAILLKAYMEEGLA
jgi:hypothetical protein